MMLFSSKTDTTPFTFQNTEVQDSFDSFLYGCETWFLTLKGE